jgi:hypothetical protein
MVRPPVDICRGTRPSQALGEYVAAADRGDCCGRDDRANARYRHEALGTIILLGQRLDLVRHSRDASIEMAPVRTEVLKHVDHAGRQLVRHGENIGHRGAQCPQPLAHRNAALEQEGADLVDHHWCAGKLGVRARDAAPEDQVVRLS